MKFKSFSIAATAAALLFASCGKEEASACRECSQSENQTIVNVVAQSGIRTKATGINDDATDTKKINSLQVFAFDSEGVLRSYENNTAGGSVSMKLNTGKEYTFYAVANNYESTTWKYPGVAAISDVTTLKEFMTDLKDNAKDNLLMFSQSGLKKTITPTVENLSIEVSRLVSKIQINRITVDFGTNAALKAKSFKLENIFVINAAAKETFSLAPAQEGTITYYNQGGLVAGAADALLLDKLTSPFELSSSAGAVTEYQNVHTFFTYGNRTERPTRLVVECSWGGEKTYYPVNITGDDGALNPNCSYIITKLTIKGMGSDDPDVIPERKEFSATVSVKDWTTGFEKTVEL